MNQKLRAAGFTLTAVLLWGWAPVANRYLVGDVHVGLAALPFVGLRFALILPLFVGVAVLGKVWRWGRADWALAVLCAVLGVTLFNVPNVMGTRTVSAGMVGLINGTEPLMILLLLAVRRRQVPGVWMILASAIGLTGIVLLVRAAGPAVGDARGIALLLFAAFSWSVYCVLVPPLLMRRGAMMVTAVVMSVGTLPMLVAGGPAMAGVAMALDAPQWWVMFFLCASAVVAIFCWSAGNAGLGAEQAGWFLYLLPVVSVAGGALMLREKVTGMEIFGGALIMVSVLIGQRWGRQA